jgi:hypothetical protein
MPVGPDIFLSHNSRDKPIVRELRDWLRGAQLTVWFDEDDLLVGKPWLDEIEQALLSAKAIIVTVGPSGLGRWEQPEMRAALIELVRRQALVIPLLLPGASEQVELPLFLQTLTWVDCRNGISDASLSRIVKSIQAAGSTSPGKTQVLPPTNSGGRPNSMADFSRFLRGTGTGSEWALRFSFLAPLAPLYLGLAPPWSGASPMKEKGAVFLMTAIVQLLAMTSAYFMFPPMRPERIRRILTVGLAVTISALAAYLVLFMMCTEIQPNTHRRLIAGWKYGKDFDLVLEDAGSVADAKMAFGWRPLEIYEPWTVWSSLILVLFVWLMFFGVIVWYVTLFVKNLPVLQQESLSDDRALVTLGLPKPLLQTLQGAEVQTIGDLCALNERQLRHILVDSGDALATVQASLRNYGVLLRD